MVNERERDEEIIGLLTGISVVARQLARKLLRLHTTPHKHIYPAKQAKYRKDGRHELCV